MSEDDEGEMVRITDERLAQMIETNELIVKTNRPVFPLSGREMTELLAEVKDARTRIAELEREREEARTALEKILAVRENPEPPSLKLFDIYHIAGDALATEANQRERNN